jgi:hypothetical protein
MLTRLKVACIRHEFSCERSVALNAGSNHKIDIDMHYSETAYALYSSAFNCSPHSALRHYWSAALDANTKDAFDV